MLSKMMTVCALLGVSTQKQLYDVNKSDVMPYTALNFDKQVTKNRDKGISIVHYYKSSGKLTSPTHPF